MTVANETLKVTALGNAVATTFSFSPVVLPNDEDDLVVTKVSSAGVETTLTRGTGAANYSVALTTAAPSTGSITYPASGTTYLATGESIVMRRVLDLLQPTDLENLGGYFPDTQEGVFDRLTYLVQQLQEQINRSLKIPVAETGAAANTTIPTVEDGAGYLYRNASDEYEISAGVADASVSPFMATVVDDADAAAAFTTLGISAYAQTILDDANAAALRVTAGLDTGFFTPGIVAAGGTVDAITATFSPALPTLADKQLVAVVSSGVNTSTTPSFAPNGQTARTIVKHGGQALVAGDTPAAKGVILLQYDLTNTRWELLNPGYAKAAAAAEVALPILYLSGGVLSHAADTDHDITISAFSARDSTNAANIVLASAITKQIDAAWAVGTGAGGLDTGSVANATIYYVWGILRSDTGVEDALFSTSSTAPTMPANYGYKVLLGAVKTNGSANILSGFFRQQRGNDVATFTSGLQTIAFDSLLSLTHMLPGKPWKVETAAYCVTGDQGFTAGEELPVSPSQDTDFGTGTSRDTTTIQVVTGVGVRVVNQSTFNNATITAANWNYIIRAEYKP